MKIRFNLLSQKQKKHLHTQKLFRIAMEQEIYFVVVILFLVLGLFAMHFVLKTEVSIVDNIKKQIVETQKYQEITEIHKKFKKVYAQMKTLIRLENSHVYWSNLFVILSDNIPSEVMVNSMKTKDNTVTIVAVAQVREDVINLKNKLEKITLNNVQCFDNIVIPESQLTVPVDVSFTMTFDVNVSCLK